MGMVAVATPSFAERISLKVCHEESYYPPYIHQEEDVSKGILVDIIKGAFEEANVAFELYSKPWVRCQQDVESGQAHALFAMIQTDERKQAFAFPPENKLSKWHLWLAQYPVFTAKGVPFVSAEYRPSKGIGAPFGYVVWDILNAKNWLSPYQYDPLEGLKMLALNKLDGYVVERHIGLQLLEMNNLATKVEMNEEIILQSRWYLPFNKDFYKSEKVLVENIWRNIAVQRKKIENSISLN
jgi:polar amino acid transport system substrate-binding protein